MPITLSRVEPKVETPDELLKLAEEQLGYTGMKVATLKPKTVEALKAAGVRPFDREQVEQYMDRQWWRANKWFFAILIGSTLALFVTPIVIAVVFGKWEILPAVVFVVLPAVMMLNPIGQEWLKQWQYTNINGYRGPVPAYALQTAMDLKPHLAPGCLDSILGGPFEIAHLDRRRSHPDPFLVLNIDGQRLYLEVWDEPGFLKERPC